MLIVHGPIATLVSINTQREDFNKLKYLEKILFILFTILLGILPDFDIFYLAARGQTALMHHHLVTHTPIFWILLSILLFVLMKLFNFPQNNRLKKMFLITFFISVTSHLFFDLFTGHLMLLYPFSKQFFTFFGNIIHDNLFAGYLVNPVFGLEILILCIFLYFFAQTFLKIKLNVIPILGALYLVFNIFMYTQTYQVEIQKKGNDGFPIYDTDKDGLANAYDFDYDNNLINNYKQVSKEELIREFNKIPKNYLKSKDRSFAQNVKYIYGGHTLTRTILQAYAQTENYLPPVVHDYMSKHGIDRFSDGLYAFLNSTNDFKQGITKEMLVPGSLVYTKWNNQYALGIVNKEKNVIIDNENGVPTTYSTNEDIKSFFIQQ